MAIPQLVTVGSLASAVANLYVTSVTPVSGTPLTLTGSAPAAPRRVLLTYGSEGSARTLALVGANFFNNQITETLSVPSGGSGTVYTVNDFKTLTSATPAGGGWTAAITLGTNGVASSPWQISNWHNTPVQISFSCVVSGTVNYTLEYSYDNIQTFYPPTVYKLTSLTAQTATADATTNDPFTYWRATINSGSGQLKVTGIQAGNVGGSN